MQELLIAPLPTPNYLIGISSTCLLEGRSHSIINTRAASSEFINLPLHVGKGREQQKRPVSYLSHPPLKPLSSKVP
jgi:hypothetical protein